MCRLAPQTLLVFLFSCLFSVLAEAQYSSYRTAVVENFIDEQRLTALSDRDDWAIGEILPVISKNSRLGIIGFVELNSLKQLSSKKYELRLRLLRQSRRYLLQSGDIIRRMDLSVENEDYQGSTDLLIRKSHLNISSRYRPLVYQGLAIGETAQTLYEDEFLLNFVGYLFYGYKDWLTINTLVPANIVDKINFAAKAKVYDTESTTLATGFSFVRLNSDSEKTINLNFYWDNLSSDALISHTFISVGLVNWGRSDESAAIKALGSSSFQSGYEVVLNDWDRFLIGPSYNFEKKALGGYLSYVWIWNRFHFQLSVNATDITHLRLDPTDGYYGFCDMYWRFW